MASLVYRTASELKISKRTLYWGDHRSIGRYDNLWSVLRPGQIAHCLNPVNICKVCVCMNDVLQTVIKN